MMHEKQMSHKHVQMMLEAACGALTSRLDKLVDELEIDHHPQLIAGMLMGMTSIYFGKWFGPKATIGALEKLIEDFKRDLN